MSYPYDPSRKALLMPAQDTRFFASGRPADESALCAEMSRLAYAPFERDQHVATAVRATLSEIGFGHCLFFSDTGTHGFMAQDRDNALTVLVFRGTELNPRNWATDLNAQLISWPAGGRVHQGFADALERVWPTVINLLAAFTGRILYTGHSLGAALATLTASRQRPHALHTFGSPRSGDAAFVATLTGTAHYRHENCCDLVCRVPPEAFGYLHAGISNYLDQHGRQLHTPGAMEVMEDQRSARMKYLYQWSWRAGTLWTRDLADHAPINYVSALRQTLHCG